MKFVAASGAARPITPQKGTQMAWISEIGEFGQPLINSWISGTPAQMIVLFPGVNAPGDAAMMVSRPLFNPHDHFGRLLVGEEMKGAHVERAILESRREM